MKTVHNFIKSVVFGIGFLLLYNITEYFLVDDTSYVRIMEHELYNPEENIDVLFLGSSHTYRAFAPEITDEIFGMNTFNAGSSSQGYDGSYALLVEAGKHNDLKKVYAEVCCSHMNNVYKDRTLLTGTYLVSDNMKFSLNKVRFLLGASSSKHYVNSFFPLSRNKEKLLNKAYIESVIALKQENAYKEYAYIGEPQVDIEWYEGKGYVANKSRIEKENWSRQDSYEAIPDNLTSKDDLRSLQSMVDYCEKNDIELIFVATPISDFRASSYGNYDYAVEQFTRFCESNGIEYYDFNLCKPDYFTYESQYYLDESHLNCYGAEKFSEVFAKFFTGQIPLEELFYDSYAEKMEAIGEKTFGVEYHVTVNESDKEIELVPICNGNPTVYASVFKKAADSEEFVEVQALGELEDVVVPVDETGQLLIYIWEDPQGQQLENEITINY